MRAALLCVAVAVGSAEAAAYVRMTTPSGVPLRWVQSCVLMSPSERPPPGLALPEITGALARAAENWNRPAQACTALTVLARMPGPRRAVADGIGAVLFLNGRWGRGEVVYDPSAAAVTTVAFRSQPGHPDDGAITDADIELNAVGFRFAMLDPAHPEAAPRPGPGQRLADLENTLTHELGHVLGLAHNCWDRETPRPPLQEDGTPAPACDGPLPERLRRGTMFPYASDGETSKRQLGEDDVRGLCGAYPKETPLPPCEQTVYGGCSAAAPQFAPRRSAATARNTTAPWTAPALLLTLLVALRGMLTHSAAPRRDRARLRGAPASLRTAHPRPSRNPPQCQ